MRSSAKRAPRDKFFENAVYQVALTIADDAPDVAQVVVREPFAVHKVLRLAMSANPKKGGRGLIGQWLNLTLNRDGRGGVAVVGGFLAIPSAAFMRASTS